jgi:pilus biogenesis lipoprotein CpaD
MNSFKIIFGLFIVAFVTGCTVKEEVPHFADPWKPEVSKKTYSDTIEFTSGSTKLSAANREKIRALVMSTEDTTPVYAHVMTHQTSVASKNSPYKQRTKAIVCNLKTLGVPSGNIDVMYEHEGSSAINKAAMSVSLDQYTATPPKCPGWTQPMPGMTVAPEGEKPFGCANVANLARMVSAPRDLQQGEKLENADGHVMSEAIKRYHIGEVKEVEVEKVSEAIQ